MYELAKKGNIKRHLITTINGKPAFNEVIPVLYYREPDLKDKVRYHDLDEFLYGGQTTFQEYFKDKYIILGDFETDLHNTYLGEIPGPFIHWNIYLTLLNKPPVIKPAWLLFTWIYFVILSYFIFKRIKKAKWIAEKERLPFIGKLIKKYVSYLGALVVLSLLSLLIFNVFISLFYLATFVTGLSVMLENNKSFRTKLINLVSDAD